MVVEVLPDPFDPLIPIPRKELGRTHTPFRRDVTADELHEDLIKQPVERLVDLFQTVSFRVRLLHLQSRQFGFESESRTY